MSSLNYFYPCKHNNMKLNNSHLKEFLDEKVELYNRPAFIEADPISIPLQFTKKTGYRGEWFTCKTVTGTRVDSKLSSKLIRQQTHCYLLSMSYTRYSLNFLIPLDIHPGNVARKPGLLTRIQNNSKAVFELDTNLRKMDSEDPVKYDFALFGLGVYEGF
jgi:Protein of unknown function (DUF2400)